MKILVRLLLVIVPFLGILDASYITYEKFNHIVPPCAPGFHCAAVLESPYASIGPIPLSLLGVMFYATALFFASLQFLERDHVKLLGMKLHTHDVMLSLSIFGAGFSFYLIYIMGVVIGAWCFYCLISAFLCSLNFFLNSFNWFGRRGECEDACSRPRAVVFGWLYTHVAKPFFFLFDAEMIHNHIMDLGEFLGSTAFGKWLTAWMFAYTSPSLEKTIDGIPFPNPVGLSAGLDYDARLTQVLPAVGFGFMTVGTVTYHPYEGNTPPRLGRFPKSRALLVNKGFKSEGAVGVIKHLTGMTFAIPVGISIGSTNKVFTSEREQIRDVITSFTLFEKSAVRHAYYELNISCPNTKGGQPFTSPELLGKLLDALEKVKVKKPVYIKMPIDLPHKEVGRLLRVAASHTIAGVIFGNLTKDKENPDVHPEDRARWKTMRGYLSGKPTWRRSNALIRFTRKTFKKRFTIIGVGGIFTPEDAREKLRCGADLIELITGMVYEGPQLIGQINQQLARVRARKK